MSPILWGWLQQRLYITFKWALLLSFADVMCFFISVYLLIGVSEKCQNILVLLLKRRKILDFHRCGIPSYFSFPKQSFVESHTIILEVWFKNREFHSLSFGCHFRCHFDCHFGCHSEFSVHLFTFLVHFSVYFFALMSTILII